MGGEMVSRPARDLERQDPEAERLAMLLSGLLKQKFQKYVIVTHQFRGDDTVILKREGLLEAARFLKENSAAVCNFLMDLSCVDYLTFEKSSQSAPSTATPSPLPFFMKPKPDPKGENWSRMGVESRFEVVYHFYSSTLNHRLRIKVPVDETDPVIDSLVAFWASANWFEREIWDMFGVIFRGHPGLKRILMYEEFVGHPIRKDYPVYKRQPRVGPVN